MRNTWMGFSGLLVGSAVMLAVIVTANRVLDFNARMNCLGYNLKALYFACAMYEAETNAPFRAVEQLTASKHAVGRMLVCPASPYRPNGNTGENLSEHTNYVLTPGTSAGAPRPVLLAWEMPANHSGQYANVVEAGHGQTRYTDTQQLLQAVQRTQDYYTHHRGVPHD